MNKISLPPLSDRADYSYLNDVSVKILSEGYLKPGTAAADARDEAIRRVNELVTTAEHKLGRNLPALRKGIRRGWASPSSPVWSNYGTERGLPISCNGSRMADSVDSIAYKVAEISMMTKEGAGTSVYMGDLRASGAPISGGGTSEGPVHFARLVQEAVSVISQSNVRRGNAAVYLDIDHPDIDDWMTMRSIIDGVHHPIQHLSFGVVITDAWMNAMLNEQKGGEKRKLLVKIVNKRRATGYPYIVFKDNANKVRHDRLKELGMEVVASNLCMTGDQRVVTSRGLLTAKELYELGTGLTLFDGEKAVKSSAMKLREEDAAVYKVTLANGMEHKITDYHKLPVRRAGQTDYEMVKCADLVIGDRIEIQTQKGLFGPLNREDEALLLGLYHGDGTNAGEMVLIDIWENLFDMEPEIIDAMDRLYAKYPVVNDLTGRVYSTPRFGECQVRTGSERKRRLSSTMFGRQLGFEKAKVPQWIWESDEATVWAYVRGLLLTDGSATVNDCAGQPISISYSSIHLHWLKDLQLLLRNLGLSASIYKMRDAGQSLLPNGKGGQDYYDTKPIWRLIVGNKNDALTIERNTGFLSRKGVQIEDRAYRDNSRKVSEVVSIDYVGREPVYCPTVDTEEHIFVAQGMRTSNCTEIFLPSTHDESFVCNLFSVNLLHFDEWKGTNFVREVVYFLDAVMSEYIEKCKAPGRRLLADALRFAERWRALGVGTLGYHSYLQQNMIPFRSDEARAKNIEMHKYVHDETLAASRQMAKEYGEPEGMKGTGQRHLTLQAIAPTRSSSLILGQVSKGIEPWEANIFEDDNAKTSFVRVNDALKALLTIKGKDNNEVWESILKNAGSVQHLDFLTDHEKAVFETFLEIGPDEVIRQNNDRTPFVDQGISLNLKIDPDTRLADNVRYIVDAWKGGSKSLYYHEGLNESQKVLRSQNACVACEA
jgi:ribonucleoside-diphosphate reductase alpha chain